MTVGTDDALAPGTILDRKFRVERALGVGGMGTVYEVHHELTHHRRALKLLHPAVAQEREVVERFLREASVAGRIGDPHITETHDAGWLSTGEPYVVMELLDGASLADLLETRGRLPVDLALDIVAQACRGAHGAHEQDIVHRDLKPENLFVTEREGEPFVKILDFGISKFGDLGPARPTRDGAVMGTPHYMAPEQFVDGKSVDRRADVYALGVVLFEALTGRLPYPATTLASLATKVLTEDAPTLSSVVPVPAVVEGVVARALARLPQDRFPTAEAMAEALQEARGETHRTRPQGSFPDPMGGRSDWGAAIADEDTVAAPGDVEATVQGLVERAEEAPASARWRPAVAGLAVVLLGGAAVLALRSTPAPAPPSTTPAARTSSAAPPPVASGSVAAPPASAAPTVAPSATAQVAPPAPSVVAAPPPPVAVPPPPVAAPPPPTSDFATMDEFPE